MRETPKTEKKAWEHVHLCSKCGHTLNPDEIEFGSIILGVITMPSTGCFAVKHPTTEANSSPRSSATQLFPCDAGAD
jgi:hypothetical protein